MDFIVIQGDIAKQRADALVSSDDTSLSMSGGVSRALLEGAGDELEESVREETPIDPGSIVVTGGFDLYVDYVIHAAVLQFGSRSMESVIRDVTRNALQAADERECRSIVFPALGSGIADVDTENSARYMMEEIDDYVPETLTDVRIIGYTPDSRWKMTEVADEVRYGAEDGDPGFSA